MNGKLKRALLMLMVPGIMMAATGCKKVNDTGNDPLSAGSSGVMSNSAGLSGRPGTSDAAKRASDTAATSSPAATASGSSDPQ